MIFLEITDGKGSGHLLPLLQIHRITSYNVCYTKLLRTHDSLPSEIKMVLSANLEGDLMNTPEGNIYLSSFNLISNGQSLRLRQLSLNSYRDEFEQQYLTVRSDYADINLYGSFEYGELGVTMFNMIAGYVPAFLTKLETGGSKSDNNRNNFV